MTAGAIVMLILAGLAIYGGLAVCIGFALKNNE